METPCYYLATTLVPFAKTLSAERRWIISGTPTTPIYLALVWGEKALNPPQVHPLKLNDGLSVHGLPEDVGIDKATSSLEASLQVHHHRALHLRKDLNKLGNMITHFIAIPQFNSPIQCRLYVNFDPCDRLCPIHVVLAGDLYENG